MISRPSLQLAILFSLFSCTIQQASAQNQPVQPTPEMPRYQLSNIRKTTDNFGRQVIAFDWKRTQEGSGYPSVSGKSKEGPLTIMSSPSMRGDSGTIAFQSFGGIFGTTDDIEFWISTSGPGGVKYMISNAIRMGNPGPKTSARAMNAKEKEAVAQAKLAATPPSGLPDGYIAVDSNTNLIPGMPVKGGWQAKWEDAEVISLHDNGQVALRYLDRGESLTIRSRETWIAVQPSVLEQGKANPQQFQASLHVLPNSRLIVPEDAVIIPEDLDLPKGTPILVDYRIKWHEAYVVDDRGDEINIRYQGYGANWDKKYPRTSCLIRTDVLANVYDPKMVEKYAKNLEGTTRARRVKDYPIRGTIPSDAQLVPADLEIPDGTKLGAYWGSRFYKMTLLGSNDDGTLHVHWDDYGDAWDCDMNRDQLIIAKSEVRKLERAMASKPKEESGENTPKSASQDVRTWKDATGKFTMQAKFISYEDGIVHLETDGGKSIKISIDKLSAADQKAVEEIQAEAAENPFLQGN